VSLPDRKPEVVETERLMLVVWKSFTWPDCLEARLLWRGEDGLFRWRLGDSLALSLEKVTKSHATCFHLRLIKILLFFVCYAIDFVHFLDSMTTNLVL
jgi:hypothetical protein